MPRASSCFITSASIGLPDSGTGGDSIGRSDQCCSHSAPCSIHCRTLSICCGVKLRLESAGGINSSGSSLVIRRKSSLPAALFFFEHRPCPIGCVQTQISLPSRLIRPMTEGTVFGKNRPNIAVKVDIVTAGSGRDQEGQETSEFDRGGHPTSLVGRIQERQRRCYGIWRSKRRSQGAGTTSLMLHGPA